MKNGFDSGNLVSYARDGLRLSPDAEFSLSDGRARELLAQMAETGNMDRPFMELVAAYGKEMRRLFAARVKDAGEMEEVENEFWIKVVQFGEAGEDSAVAFPLPETISLLGGAVCYNSWLIDTFGSLQNGNRLSTSLRFLYSSWLDCQGALRLFFGGTPGFHSMAGAGWRFSSSSSALSIGNGI